MKVSARSAGGQVCILHLARFSDFLGMKIAGIEPAVPQIRKIDAIWVGSELGCAETLEACAEKVGFCTTADAAIVTGIAATATRIVSHV